MSFSDGDTGQVLERDECPLPTSPIAVGLPRPVPRKALGRAEKLTTRENRKGRRGKELVGLIQKMRSYGQLPAEQTESQASVTFRPSAPLGNFLGENGLALPVFHSLVIRWQEC